MKTIVPILTLMLLAAEVDAAKISRITPTEKPSQKERKESEGEIERQIQAGEKAAREYADELAKNTKDAKPPVAQENGKLRRAVACGVKVYEVVSETEVTGWRREAGRTGDFAFFKFEEPHNLASDEIALASDWTDGGTIKRKGQVLRVWVQNPGTKDKYKKYGY